MHSVDHNAIINPISGKKSPQLGSVALMASTEADLCLLCSQLSLDAGKFQKLFNSRLYIAPGPSRGLSLSGPLIGAPYAVMLLETIIAWGAKKILFLGWCGAISPHTKIGDIIIPTSAIIDEGTSAHYVPGIIESRPSDELMAKTRRFLRNNGLRYHEGTIWSTDAVYRETPEKVSYFQAKGALAVEMETSALFTVAGFRRMDALAILVVSDELSTSSWQPGFKDSKFKKGRKAACSLIKSLCQIL
jgi:purine-nucleoside phosphorylase